MIIPDINLLVHAHDADSPVHGPSRAWLEDLLSKPAPVGIPWVVALGYIRISAHPRILASPLTPDVARGHVESWLAQPQTMLIQPGERHATVLFDLLRRLGTAGNLTTDAHAPSHLELIVLELREMNIREVQLPARFSTR